MLGNGAPRASLVVAAFFFISLFFFQKSKYQQSIILETGKMYGRQLFLDCMPQSSEADEFIYHEVSLTF